MGRIVALLSQIICDAAMEKVFRCKSFGMMKMAGKLNQHLKAVNELVGGTESESGASDDDDDDDEDDEDGNKKPTKKRARAAKDDAKKKPAKKSKASKKVKLAVQQYLEGAH